MDKKVCIFGLGYIGLPTALLIASNGYKVIGIDVNKDVVKSLNNAELHIIEPGLEELLKKNIDEKKLVASSSPVTCDVYIICVPTPFHNEKNNAGNPKPNLEYVNDVVYSLKSLVKSGDIVILESTSPIGTTEYIYNELKEVLNYGEDIYVGYCPERVLPGNILYELVENDRIIGGINNASTKKVSEFYKNFVNGSIFETNSKTAEMCKLVENSYRDTNIAFANEISLIANELEIDEWELIMLANKHPRVNILNPGIGVGGHCIAVDPWFLVDKNPEESILIKSARERNLSKTDWVIKKCREKITEISVEKGKCPKVIVLGLAYKPDIDDLRESPALNIFNELLRDNIKLEAIEPNIARSEKDKIFDINHNFDDADLVISLVPHSLFKRDKFLKKILSHDYLDFCGLINQK